MAQTARRRPLVTDGAQGIDQFCKNVDPTITATKSRPQVGPHRNHVEARSYDAVPPRQCVADDHSIKNPPREVNAMSATLASVFKWENIDD